MKWTDLYMAMQEVDVDEDELCHAIEVILPALRELRNKASGWKVWIRWALSLVITLLEEYHDYRCVSG